MIKKELFGKLDDVNEIYIYTLSNLKGMIVKIINYGAIVVSILVPDKNGIYDDIVLGYDNLKAYINDKFYFGAIIGRYANRINKGQFELNGKRYQLELNDGLNHLHGGTKGFHKVVWDAEPFIYNSDQSLKLKYYSHDGEGGYPGNLKIMVIYTLTQNNELQIEYIAETDKKTILNPTHHSYFNLSGSADKTILEHQIKINADYIVDINEDLTPTGKLINVNNTPFDFRKFREMGARINDKNELLAFANGYDHSFVLNDYNHSVRKVAEVFEPVSGRLLSIHSDQPGLQFYSGNYLNGSIIGKEGKIYSFRAGFCLEAQHFPDSPNHKNFPPVVLEPGQRYIQRTMYKFSIKQ
ncbi:aldose epimerase family protein [Melioribacteraceae bacterium 4301-Me]|uniref:aldose epimerase family protein n=1 Tax=Pyranulibacter aquaticus TaxID=3163344 RepID=UPI00359ADFC7